METKNVNKWIAGAGLVMSLATASAAPLEDGFYRGKYFGGEVKQKDQERIKIIVETVQVESSDDPTATVPLTLALLLKEQSDEAGLFIIDELPDGSYNWRALTTRNVGQGEYAWEVPAVISGDRRYGEFNGTVVSRGKRPELRLRPTASGKQEGCAHEIRVRKASRERLQFLMLPDDQDVIARDRLREKKAKNSLTITHKDHRAEGTIEGSANSEIGKFTLVDVDEFGGKILYSFYPTQQDGEMASGKIPGHTLSALAVFLKRDRAMLWDRKEIRLIKMTNDGAGCTRPTVKLKKRMK